MLKKLVVCKFAGCGQVYIDPRILPCGKRTCAAHIEEMIVNNDRDSDRLMINCQFCQKIHTFPEDSGEFPVDENIPILLNMKYSNEHDAAKKIVNEVTQLLEKLVKLEGEYYVIDYFEQVESEILLDKEINQQKLDAYYQKLVGRVHERKFECLKNLKTNKTPQSELNAIKQELMQHLTKLKKENLDFILKTHDGDEANWKDLHSKCNILLETTKSLANELSERIINVQMIEFRRSERNNQIENRCGHLDEKVVNSKILSTEKLKNDLIELCKLSEKQFRLIYRATRDGFEASSFHAKCDNKPRTLTIIKTTLGYIFGGYTDATWESTNIHKADPKAFICSLINKSYSPQLIPVKSGDLYAIRCNSANGPAFGSAYDIIISSNSNTNTSSYSNLGTSYNLLYMSQEQARTYLAGSCNFQTSEIEVFQFI